MDSRLNGRFGDWLRGKGFESSDMISITGSTLAIAQGSIWLPWRWSLWMEKVVLMRQLHLAVQLHGVTIIVVAHHSTCGAYARRHCFSSFKKEKEKQLADMKKTKKIINRKFPGLTVMLVWTELQDNDGKNVCFSVIE